MITAEQLAFIEKSAAHTRYNIIKMIGAGNKGHFGGSLSCTDIVSTLYFYKMKYDPKNPNWEGRDRFIMSKGHAAYTQYCALAVLGVIEDEELWNAKKVGAMLQGHPDMIKTPGIECNTGSLGQGISQACGMAAGLKLDGSDSKVYVVLGDGEMAEGQVWEATMSAYNFHLDNLVVVLDSNKLGSQGFWKDRFDYGDIPAKWASFGWDVYECDGHDAKALADVLDKTDEKNGRPKFICAHTIKGKGLSFAENVVSFHNGTMTQQQVDDALAELAAKMA